MMLGTSYMARLDLSRVAVNGITDPRLRANNPCLPLTDDSFTAIVSMEMLEHLPQKIYRIMLGEFLLAASRFVLGTLPYKQRLEYYKVVCPAYLCSFHPFHPLRSYPQSDFTNFFGPHTHLVKLETVIPATTEALPGPWNLIRRDYHRQGMNLPHTTVFPRCRFTVSKNDICMRKTSSSALMKSTLYHLWPNGNYCLPRVAKAKQAVSQAFYGVV